MRSGECPASQKDLEHCAACVCHVYSTVLPLFSGLPGAVAYCKQLLYTKKLMSYLNILVACNQSEGKVRGKKGKNRKN